MSVPGGTHLATAIANAFSRADRLVRAALRVERRDRVQAQIVHFWHLISGASELQAVAADAPAMSWSGQRSGFVIRPRPTPRATRPTPRGGCDQRARLPHHKPAHVPCSGLHPQPWPSGRNRTSRCPQIASCLVSTFCPRCPAMSASLGTFNYRERSGHVWTRQARRRPLGNHRRVRWQREPARQPRPVRCCHFVVAGPRADPRAVPDAHRAEAAPRNARGRRCLRRSGDLPGAERTWFWHACRPGCRSIPRLWPIIRCACRGRGQAARPQISTGPYTPRRQPAWKLQGLPCSTAPGTCRASGRFPCAIHPGAGESSG